MIDEQFFSDEFEEQNFKHYATKERKIGTKVLRSICSAVDEEQKWGYGVVN